MNDQTDAQLLRAYAEKRSEPAFAELVRRHVDLVYSAAQRMVCDSHLADDVTQAVFVALAKNAAQLADHRVLSGWLHRTSQNIAAQTVRTEVRRHAREQESVAMNELHVVESDAPWEQIAPHLDAVLGELNETDRDAVLLRYFERKSAREMAQALGISDEAAQKRVGRAVERLRELFAKRGVTVGASGFVLVVSANAVQSAPMALSATISSAIALGFVLESGGTIAAGKTLIMTTTQKALLATLLAAALGTGVYEVAQNAQLRKELRQMNQQLKPLGEQNERFRREQERLQAQLLAAQQEAEQGRRQIAELAKLRGEVTRLREHERELAGAQALGAETPAQTELKSWLARVDQLKKRLDEKPDQKIPELELITEQDWLDAAHGKLDTDKALREALSRLRRTAENKFAIRMQVALKKYLEANQGKYPTDVLELPSYFTPPIEASALQRYEIALPVTSPTGKVNGEWRVTQKAPIDERFDARFDIRPDNIGSRYPAWRTRTTEASDWETLSPAMAAYSGIFGIREPSDYSLLRPYVTTPEQKAALEKVIQEAEKE